MRWGSRTLARLVLALMLATFLSPSFGWHAHAHHDEIVGESLVDDHDHHGEAHSSIGHVLGHMSMQVVMPRIAIPAADDAAPSDEVAPLRLLSGTSPPYRPPLDRRLA